MFRWGIIAPGRIAHQFAQSLSVVPDGELVAVASRSLSRGAEFARRYNALKTYQDYQDLLHDPAVDGVYIASPHRFHFEQAMMALEARKPVLCEKPLTVNHAEAAALTHKASESSVFLMEGLWSRFLPFYQDIQRRIQHGEIGELRFINSAFCITVSRDVNERWLNPELAGGALLDMGVYNVAVSQFLMGTDPMDVQASGLIGSSGVDEAVSVILNYGDGIISSFHASLNLNARNAMRVWGTKGSIEIHPNFWSATRADVRVGDQVERIEAPFLANGFEYQIMEAQRCIQAGKLEPEAMPHAATLANMRVLDQVRQRIGLKYPFEVE
jgi:predicted dehydrogenase